MRRIAGLAETLGIPLEQLLGHRLAPLAAPMIEVEAEEVRTEEER